MNEIDCLLAGIGGGILGAFGVLFAMHHHWKKLTQEYVEARRQMQESFSVLNMEDEIELINRALKEMKK